MVVVDNKCDCSGIPPVTMDPIEIMYILSTAAMALFLFTVLHVTLTLNL